jgi:hypothetical protein
MEWKCTSSSYRENYAYSLGIQAYIYMDIRLLQWKEPDSCKR